MYAVKMILMSALLTTLAFADAQEGKEMFDEAKCMDCHNAEDFGGKDTKVTKYQHIKDYTDACQTNNDAEWFEEDVDSVTEYLNDKYYKFKR